MKAIDFFDEVFFWDCQVDKIDLQDDKDLVIERVLSRSLNRADDFKKLAEIYPPAEIKKYALESTQIFGNERIENIASFFDLNKYEFSNYIY